MNNLSEVFGYVTRDLNELYKYIDDKYMFHWKLLQCLRSSLNKKRWKEAYHFLSMYRKKLIIHHFERFYDNWYAFQLKCFFDDHPTDSYDTIKEFTLLYIGGQFGCPSYVASREDERLKSILLSL